MVGAGPAGLVAGITLARYGIDVVVLDKRDGLSGLSRNLVISTRGMELMRRFGLEEAIRAGAADVKLRAWVTHDLACGEGTEMPLGYPSDAEAASASPTRPAWAAQDHHEPILVEHLRSLPGATVRFGCELLELAQDAEGVEIVVAEVETGIVEHISASYLIAADGAHSAARDQLRIGMVGSHDLADYERVEFSAPLWPVVGAHRYGLYVITRPDAAGVLTPRGPNDHWGLNRETPIGTNGLTELGHEELSGLIRRAAGTEVRPQIERLSTFTFAAQLAERYAEARCFLVGDAAHRMTPRGGTGMNTAIQDSFDLGWKLAWVLAPDGPVPNCLRAMTANGGPSPPTTSNGPANQPAPAGKPTKPCHPTQRPPTPPLVVDWSRADIHDRSHRGWAHPVDRTVRSRLGPFLSIYGVRCADRRAHPRRRHRGCSRPTADRRPLGATRRTRAATMDQRRRRSGTGFAIGDRLMSHEQLAPTTPDSYWTRKLSG